MILLVTSNQLKTMFKNCVKTEFGPSLLESSCLLTIQDLSKYLSVPVSTIRSWMYKRQIPYVKFGNGRRSHVRFNPKLIFDWIDKIQKAPQLKEKGSICSPSNVKVEVASNKTVSEFNSFINNLKEAT